MKSLVFILLLAGLEGCATSTHFKAIQSQVAPGKHYQNIYVHCNVQDMGERQTVEDQVVQQIATYGIPAKPSYEDFPTGFTATLAHKRLVVQALGFDAALFIKITNNNVTQEAVTTAITEVHHDDRAHSNIAGLYQPDDDDFIPTVVTIYTAHFTIDTKLVDTQNFTPVWQATSKSKEVVHGPNDVSLEEIMESYGSALVNEWIKEGVVLDRTKK